MMHGPAHRRWPKTVTTKGQANRVPRVPARLVRAMFAVVCLDTGNGARSGDWPTWWDHSGTRDSHRANVERLRTAVEAAMVHEVY